MRRRNRPITHIRLEFEFLESRFLLASFLRLDGGGSGELNTFDSDNVAISSGIADELQSGEGGDVLKRSSATGIGKDEYGYAMAHSDQTAWVPIPVGSSIGVASASVAGSYLLTVEDYAYAEVYSSWAQARATYETLDTGNLVAHYFIGIYGGEVVLGSASVNDQNYLARVQIGDDWVQATYALGNVWTVTTSWGFTYDSEGGVNLHIFGPATISTNSFTVAATESVARTAFSYDPGLAEVIWNVSAAGWIYEIPQGGSFASGDFNYDGNVDEEDFDIWAAGSPQADVSPIGAPDGIVDEHDYAAWAATADAILVSTSVDENDGNYTFGDLSLREAIALAADVNHPGADMIAFDEGLFGDTIVLTLGQLNIGSTNEVKILGPGADQLAVDGNGGNVSIFSVTGGGPTPISSRISHLKLTGTGTSGNGVTQSDANGNHDLALDSLEIVDNGYGVRHSGSGQIVIRDSLVAENYADGIARTTSSPPADFATVNIIDSVVRDNGLSGIALRNMDVSINGSEVFGNNTRTLLGKAIKFQSSDEVPLVGLTILNCTIAENNGDGISIDGDTDAKIANTTISSNAGLGLSVTNADATLTNVTVTQNRVATSGSTAGVYAGTGGTITMHNTIVAQNFSGTGGSETDADLGKSNSNPAGSFNLGTTSYNLIGVVGNSGITSINDNIILNGADAGLVALGDYGGRTRTHALLSTSLALDAGDDSKAEAVDLLFDQRGQDYERIVAKDGTPDPGFDIDIGAFEMALGEVFN